MSDNENTISRRKMLARIGGVAAAAYAVPAFTTMSMAHASDGGSAASSESSASSMSSMSSTSSMSEASDMSEASVASSPSDCDEMGGVWNEETGMCDMPVEG